MGYIISSIFHTHLRRKPSTLTTPDLARRSLKPPTSTPLVGARGVARGSLSSLALVTSSASAMARKKKPAPPPPPSTTLTVSTSSGLPPPVVSRLDTDQIYKGWVAKNVKNSQVPTLYFQQIHNNMYQSTINRVCCVETDMFSTLFRRLRYIDILVLLYDEENISFLKSLFIFPFPVSPNQEASSSRAPYLRHYFYTQQLHQFQSRRVNCPVS